MAVDPLTGLEITQPSPAEERIKSLSEKVRLTSEERDEKNRLLEESTKKIADLEKENAFNTGFVDVIATHAAAKDHKDEIKAKVIAGYTVEDATFAVLGKAGKLGQAPAPEVPNPAGGSATNALPQGGVKPISEMTQAERREQLEKDMVWT